MKKPLLLLIALCGCDTRRAECERLLPVVRAVGAQLRPRLPDDAPANAARAREVRAQLALLSGLGIRTPGLAARTDAFGSAATAGAATLESRSRAQGEGAAAVPAIDTATMEQQLARIEELCAGGDPQK